MQTDAAVLRPFFSTLPKTTRPISTVVATCRTTGLQVDLVVTLTRTDHALALRDGGATDMVLTSPGFAASSASVDPFLADLQVTPIRRVQRRLDGGKIGRRFGHVEIQPALFRTDLAAGHRTRDHHRQRCNAVCTRMWRWRRSQ